MTQEHLFIVRGAGNDTVGLVGSITTPIAEAGGNILDLRQDVLHGLFTIFLVVDLSGTQLHMKDLETLIGEIAEKTGLELAVDRYFPTPGAPKTQNMLAILIGGDKPGIISSMSATLGKYGVNIELAEAIGREGLFLTELMTDVSRCAIPVENLKSTLGKLMAGMKIQTFFQTEDVYNKKKRIVLFDIAGSLLPDAVLNEIIQQTDLTREEIAAAYSTDALPALQKAAQCLDGVLGDTVDAINAGVRPTEGVVQLIHTLKTLGYRCVLTSNGFSPFIASIQPKLGLDCAYGVPLKIDNDEQTVIGEITQADCDAKALDRVIASVSAQESVGREDIAIIDDKDLPEPIGIRLQFELDKLLELYNKRVLSKENMLGVLGSFGVLKSIK
ncbi:hypothetical protein JXA32_10955 [Candidatus Sumerlaeota bacterium]|nr:hypothetical protein [Candidatus Sumerlaeota bacterium]